MGRIREPDALLRSSSRQGTQVAGGAAAGLAGRGGMHTARRRRRSGVVLRRAGSRGMRTEAGARARAQGASSDEVLATAHLDHGPETAQAA